MFSKFENLDKKNCFLGEFQVDEFMLMTDEEKTKLKWNFLLEKLRFGIQVFDFKLHF